MVIFASISIGLLIVLISMYFIRKEVLNASFFKHVKVSATGQLDTDQILKQIQALENLVDDMNQSFYDIASDLEGKYSVHEKQMTDLEEQMSALQVQFKTLNETINYQGRAINKIKSDDDVQPKKLTDPKNKMNKSQEALRDEVMKLKALGYDDAQIARSLKKGITEIRMLMELTK